MKTIKKPKRSLDNLPEYQMISKFYSENSYRQNKELYKEKEKEFSKMRSKIIGKILEDDKITQMIIEREKELKKLYRQRLELWGIYFSA